MFHAPDLTIPSESEGGLVYPWAATSGPKSADPGSRLSATAMARGGTGMSGEVGDLAQSVGRDGEKVGPWCWSVEGMEGVELGLGIDGVMLLFGCSFNLSNVLYVRTLSKKELRCEDGAMLPFMAAYPVHVCTSPDRAVLGPSHLRKFHLHLNSKFKTGCVHFCLLSSSQVLYHFSNLDMLWHPSHAHHHSPISLWERGISGLLLLLLLFLLLLLLFGCWCCYSAAASVAVTLLFCLQIRWAL